MFDEQSRSAIVLVTEERAHGLLGSIFVFLDSLLGILAIYLDDHRGLFDSFRGRYVQNRLRVLRRLDIMFGSDDEK